jgi:hypothetical protein
MHIMKKEFLIIVGLIIAVVLGSNLYDVYDKHQKDAAQAAQKAEEQRKEAERRATPRWEYVDSSREGSTFSVYLPAQVDKQYPNQRLAWYKVVHKDGSYDVFYDRYDCENKYDADLSYATYNAKGQQVYAGNLNSRWTYQIPSTIGFEMLTEVCK